MSQPPQQQKGHVAYLQSHTVEINTGRKMMLRYLTKPITKTFSESLAER